MDPGGEEPYFIEGMLLKKVYEPLIYVNVKLHRLDTKALLAVCLYA